MLIKITPCFGKFITLSTFEGIKLKGVKLLLEIYQHKLAIATLEKGTAQ